MTGIVTTGYETDRRLLETITTYLASRTDGAARRFRDAFDVDVGNWQAVPANHLPAAETLVDAGPLSAGAEHDVVTAFACVRHALKWEQSYTKADGVVGDDMLNGYGFAEIVGKLGPFVSDKVRSGIGVWGPNIDYPAHSHGAEEVYVVVAGEAEFTVGDAPSAWRRTGDAVLVPSNTVHGFRTGTKPLVVLYVWQDGDLREISTFQDSA